MNSILDDFQIGFLDIDTGIPQRLDADSYHGLLGLYAAKLAFKAFQRTTNNAYLFAGLEKMIVHLNHGFGLLEHKLQALDLRVGYNGRCFLTWIGQQLVNE